MTPTALPERIRTPDLELRRNDPALAAEIFEVVDRERERLGFLPWVELTLQPEDTLAYLVRTMNQWDNLDLFDYNILQVSTGAYAGNIGLHNLSWRHARAELGYWLVEAAEGRGWMRQAVIALEQAAFEAGFERLEIRCDPQNVRSARVAERLGYRFEGHLRANVIDRGERRDTLVFGKLVGE